MEFHRYVVVFLTVILGLGLGESPAQDTDRPYRGPYLNYEELTDSLRIVAESAPDLVEMRSLTETPEGRSVWLITVAAQRNRRPLQYRPAFLATGSLHAVEIAGSMQGLYLARYLAENYGSDPRVTRLLNEHVFYIIPRVAVDGTEHIMNTLHQVRSKHVEVQERNVPFPQDVNGDGLILSMRWEDPEGNYRVSDLDPRLLVSRSEKDTTGTFYSRATEGLIHNWDGETVRSSDIRVDFNREFPGHWRPFYGWIGQGRYPMSQPETRAVGEFILSHPNIVGASDYHTGNYAIFYPHGAVEGETDYPDDAATVREIGRRGAEHTGFPLVSSYGEIRTGVPTADRIPGVFKDWLFDQLGIPAYTVELGVMYNYLGVPPDRLFSAGEDRGRITDRVHLDWEEAHPEHELFIEWEAANHPQLGRVEVGGWNPILESNPPPDSLYSVLYRTTQFALDQAAYAPKLRVADVTVQPLDGNLYKLQVDLRNDGPVPTSVTNRMEDVRPHTNAEVRLTGPEEVEFVTGSGYSTLTPVQAYGNRTLTWVLRTSAEQLQLRITSEKGLYLTREITL